ncbi:pilus assembly protein TadG-related protein [Hyphomonas sp.]|uniref:pilus assembly protein TadG-related protein n=1 Tax=Hyphomonas sp. TaxID=87 RepID=UPI0035276BFF
MMSELKNIQVLVQRYRQDTRGNIMMLTALVIVAIMGLAGFAIDLRYTLSQKEKVQYALDSAVLAGALERQKGRTEEEVKAEVRDYAGSLIDLQDGGLSCTTINVALDSVSEDISASISCMQPTFISQIMGHDHLDFTVSTTSTYSVGKVDVAFVFDVSGSMNSYNRLSLLKTAANAALDTLLPDDKPDDKTIRIAITTYNNSVNAGSYINAVTDGVSLAADASNIAASANFNSYNGKRMYDSATGKRFFYYQTGTCLDSGTCDQWSNWDWDPARRKYEDVSVTSSCVYERTGSQADTDATPGSLAWIGAANPEWNFGTTDRNKYRGWQEVAYGGANSNTGAYYNNYATCRDSGPVPLTDDKAALKAHVNSLTAGGGTAGHLGIAWGWYLISPNWSSIWPTASKPWDYDEVNATKAVILMTDGDFNREHATATKDSFHQSMDLCDRMKASPSKVTIYTVGFQVPEAVQKTGDGKTILEYCATSPAFAYSAADGDQLLEVYKEIAQSIADLRIKQ